jgi:protein arginine N-methyltransferase 1
MPHEYSILDYSEMIADRVRTDAYCRALRAHVRPGSVVLDIGTATGFLALMACQLGARRVFGIDPSITVTLARELAALNGCESKVEFIQDLSTAVTLPERADVIVSDLRGVTPLFQGGLTAILDARERLLAPGGVLIPQVDTLWAALAQRPALFEKRLGATDTDVFGINMGPSRRFVMNSPWRARLRPADLLVEPQCWATLDYRTFHDMNVQDSLDWTLDRPVTAHGLAIWFDSVLTEGIGYSNAPGRGNTSVYGNVMMPFEAALDLKAGDVVTVDVSARIVRSEYVWRWDTSVATGGGKPVRRFSQSNFFSRLRSRTDMKRRAPSFLPRLSERGQISRLVLDMMTGRAPLTTIASTVTETFPASFGTPDDAMQYVSDLSARYSE